MDEHLARHRLADLVLDTLPYNAHTTASDALWAGLPVLTRTGETFASRVAASLLRAIGLPELITATESEFEELAVELAHNPQRLQALRQRLQQNRPTAPLFDCASFTRHLESAYTAIVRPLPRRPPPRPHPHPPLNAAFPWARMEGTQLIAVRLIAYSSGIMPFVLPCRVPHSAQYYRDESDAP